MQFCLTHKNHSNYSMYVYKNATHAWESGVNTTAIGKWPIRFNLDATQLAEDRTREFFDKTLKD
jgi:dienelactone hydrolase